MDHDRTKSVGRILVVEDHDDTRRMLTLALKAQGYKVFNAVDAEKAVGFMDEKIDLVLSDLRMGDVSGIDLLQLWKKNKPETQFILCTGFGAIDNAVEAMRAGAADYITKPVDPADLVARIRRTLADLQQKSGPVHKSVAAKEFVGQSRKMKDVFDKIQRAAAVDSTVLILGESGTGKELVAQALHRQSPRKDKPFVAVNCAAVPASLVESELFGHVKGAFTGAIDGRMGRFEQADKGTLFIDEIGDFELGLQAKLLRVLETLTVTPVGGSAEKKFDVRVLAATSRDIHAMLRKGTFREDLFYRLNVITIQLPPLRERPDDIPPLVEHFVRMIAAANQSVPPTLSPEVMERVQAYPWPGNVRELRNALESMMVLAEGNELTAKDLPDRLIPRPPVGAK